MKIPIPFKGRYASALSYEEIRKKFRQYEKEQPEEKMQVEMKIGSPVIRIWKGYRNILNTRGGTYYCKIRLHVTSIKPCEVTIDIHLPYFELTINFIFSIIIFYFVISKKAEIEKTFGEYMYIPFLFLAIQQLVRTVHQVFFLLRQTRQWLESDLALTPLP